MLEQMFRISFKTHEVIIDRVKFLQYSWYKLTGSTGMRTRLNKTERMLLYILNGNCKFNQLSNLIDQAYDQIVKRMKTSMLPKLVSRLNFLKCAKEAIDDVTNPLT